MARATSGSFKPRAIPEKPRMEKVLSPKEAGNYLAGMGLRVGEQRIRQLVRYGCLERLRAFKGRYLIPASNLEAFFSETQKQKWKGARQ